MQPGIIKLVNLGGSVWLIRVIYGCVNRQNICSS